MSGIISGIRGGAASEPTMEQAILDAFAEESAEMSHALLEIVDH